MASVWKDLESNVVEGIPFPDNFRTNTALEYKAKPNDIFVVTYPKCGTNWTCEIIDLIFKKGEPLSTEKGPMTVPFLDMVGAEAIENFPRPCAIRTHIPFRIMPASPEAKYIYVVRNPKDCCVSYYYHTKNMSNVGDELTFDDFFEHFITGKVYYGDYFDQVLEGYEHRNDNNVLFITYESMKEHPKDSVLKIASFLGEEYVKPLKENEECLNNVIKNSSVSAMKERINKKMDSLLSMSPEKLMQSSDIPEGMKQALLKRFEKMKESGSSRPTQANFIRKGIIGDWKNHFSPEQNKRMDEIFLERTKGTDYPKWLKDHMELATSSNE